MTDDAFEAGLAQRHAMFGTAGGQEQLDAATWEHRNGWFPNAICYW